MTTLDRYVLRKFSVPFLYCFAGFVGIWFIFDLADNLQDFIQGQASAEALVDYYASQVPEIIVIALPLATLLALLYSLAGMSRSNEIISMLGAGRSILRILTPLLFVGLFLTGVTAFFNYEGAPHATGMKKVIVGDIKRGKKSDKTIKGHLFRNREDRRFWFISRLNPLIERFAWIQIIQEDAEGDLQRNYYAEEASYDHDDKTWRLSNGKVVDFNEKGDIKEQQWFQKLQLRNFSETPWRISSSVLDANFLSVPELRDYLKYNSHFTAMRLAPYRTQLDYRWALPWSCFVAVLIAGPLGIVYSRRGIMGSITMAIGLFFLLILGSSLFLALGKGDRINAVLAAWGPVVFFGGTGAFMIWMRTTNREVPNILS